MVECNPVAPQQEVQPAVTEPAPDSSDLAQPGSDQSVIRPSAAVTDRAAIRADGLARPPVAHLINPADGFSEQPILGNPDAKAWLMQLNGN